MPAILFKDKESEFQYYLRNYILDFGIFNDKMLNFMSNLRKGECNIDSIKMSFEQLKCTAKYFMADTAKLIDIYDTNSEYYNKLLNQFNIDAQTSITIDSIHQMYYALKDYNISLQNR